jgi:PAS domain S-box-containing protein
MESEFKYRALVEQIPAITYIADIDELSTTLFISPQVEEILGFKPDEWRKGQDIWLKQIHPDDRERVLSEVKGTHENGEPLISEYRMITRRGQVIWISDRAVIISDEQGEPRFLQGAMFDITKRKEMDKALKKAYDEMEERVVERTTKLNRMLTELQESEAQLCAVLSSLREHVCVLDPKGRITTVNEAWLRFARENDAQSEELISPGADYLEICRKAAEQGDDYAQQALDGIKGILDRQKDSFRLEYPCSSPEIYRWFSMMVVPLQNPEGGVVISHRDFTKRKQFEKELQQNEKSLAEAQQIAHLGNWYWDVINNETYWSNELFNIFGVTPDITKPSKNAFLERVHPDDRHRLEKHIAATLNNNEPFSIDHRIILPDGSVRFLNSMARMERDAENNPVRLFGIAQDITERKETEEELKIKDIAISSSISAIGMTDPEGRLVYVNDAFVKMWGFDGAEEILGRSLPEFWKGEGIVETIRTLHEKGGKIGEDIAKRKDGSLFHVQFSASMIKDDEGNPLRMFGSFVDVSKRKLAEEALHQSEATLRHLSSKLLEAHEEESKRIGQELHDGLAQTLSAVKLWGEAALMHLKEENTSQLTKPLESIVALARGSVEEVRRIIMNLRPTILDDLGILATISWLCQDFQALHPGIQIHQKIDIQEDDMPEALKTVIFRVIQEVLNNVAKHSKADHVDLFLKQDDGKIKLTISDNGIGFDTEQMTYFDQFKKGLGLSSMKERVSLSSGTFSIDSKEGLGTTVLAFW